jgi:hypothetical protein
MNGMNGMKKVIREALETNSAQKDWKNFDKMERKLSKRNGSFHSPVNNPPTIAMHSVIRIPNS